MGNDSNVICESAPRAAHGVAQVAVTHRLHPRVLELSMSIKRIWQCIDDIFT
jgi:hypothetical protein